MPVISRIAPLHDAMTAWRRDIHQHPELAYAEHRTARTVADLLRGFGVDEVIEGVGQTGVVGVLRNGPGPSIGLRADMDALPIEELADRPYRSVHSNTMHACGHDGHTAMLLGAARYLAETRRFAGTVVLVFQPAEEGQAGAKAMIDDGLFERFPMQAIYGVHNMPGLPAGSLSFSAGPIMAAADRFRVILRGQGGHAAAPHSCRDPVIAAAGLIQALQTVVSRSCPPAETLVVSVTEVHGGDAFNVIPDSVRVSGTVRYFNPEIGALARQRMKAIIDGIAAAHGMEADYEYFEGYPPTVNWPEAIEAARAAALTVAGEDGTLDQAPRMFAEDFSYFLQKKPGAYGFIGNGESGELGCTGLHNPHYDFNDTILTTGASFFAALVERELPVG